MLCYDYTCEYKKDIENTTYQSATIQILIKLLYILFHAQAKIQLTILSNSNILSYRLLLSKTSNNHDSNQYLITNTIHEIIQVSKKCKKHLGHGEQGTKVAWHSGLKGRSKMQSIISNKKPHNQLQKNRDATSKFKTLNSISYNLTINQTKLGASSILKWLFI